MLMFRKERKRYLGPEHGVLWSETMPGWVSKFLGFNAFN